MDPEKLDAYVLAMMEISHQRYLRREATGWLVLCYAQGEVDEFGSDAIVGAYGPYPDPETALIEKVKHDATSDEGFKNVIIPLLPPVKWRDE